MELVAGACGAVATGSVGTTTGAGAEADDADGVTLVAAAGDDGVADGASIGGDVVADDGPAGDAAGSERALVLAPLGRDAARLVAEARTLGASPASLQAPPAMVGPPGPRGPARP